MKLRDLAPGTSFRVVNSPLLYIVVAQIPGRMGPTSDTTSYKSPEGFTPELPPLMSADTEVEVGD